jgi:ubiquitin-protein ligase E3 A
MGRVVPYLICQVNRDRLLEDAMIFAHETKDFKKPLRVIFKGEKGIDEGGVRREFFGLASYELFNARFGMFKGCSNDRLLWFNPCTFDPPVRF